MKDPLLDDVDIVTHILQQHWQSFIAAIPSMFVGGIILLFAWGMARIAAHLVRVFLRKKLHQLLLENIITRGVGVLVFLFGVYLIFEMTNLTGAAFTIVSGTGLLGVILGIAFRDITENLLASILLSIHHPFQNGDLVEIEGFSGYVQGLTMRVTLLLSPEGHCIQIPNAMVYKSTILNYTTAPHRREDFFVAIGYDISIAKAQKIAQEACAKIDGVLEHPRPSVFVDFFGKSSVRLRVYFWFNGTLYPRLKMRSCAMARVKEALQEENIFIMS